MSQTTFNLDGEFKSPEQRYSENVPFETTKEYFMLNGVEMYFDFKKEYFGMISHFDFYSVDEKKPNLISETGYRSWFIDLELCELKSIREVVEEFIKDLGKKYILVWKDEQFRSRL